MKNKAYKKVFKGVLHNKTMKKSGDLCFSYISLNSLGLKKSNYNNLICCNLKVTPFSNSPNHLEMVNGS